MYLFNQLLRFYQSISNTLSIANWISPFILRVVLAWEFFEAGIEKYHGENWFADLNFPFPFNLFSADVNWVMAMGFELVGAFALLLGLATRFFSAALLTITIIAIATVHWPEHWDTLSELIKGYRFTDKNGDGFGNYKLPLLYIVMLMSLLFGGAGKVSFDDWIYKKLYKYNLT